LGVEKIAVIGGGPAGLSVCHQLVRHLGDVRENPIYIKVYEKGETIGPGLPYLDREEALTLTFPIRFMDISNNGKRDFRGFLSSTIGQEIDEYPQRYLFGDYLELYSKTLKEDAYELGIVIEYATKNEVFDISENDGLFKVFSNDGAENFGQVVLCTGHMPSDNYAFFLSEKNYFHNPWSFDRYKMIDPESNICILGSRLTAIDVALYLKSVGHKGGVTMFSRSGRLPIVLSNDIPQYQLKHISIDSCKKAAAKTDGKLRLQALFRMFLKELKEAEKDYGSNISYRDSFAILFGKDPKSSIKHSLELAERDSIPWQRVFISFYYILPDIWMMLSDSERKRFMELYYSTYMTFIAFPISNARKISDLLHSGELEIRGGLVSVEKRGDKFSISTNSKVFQYDYIINGTGPGYNSDMVPLFRRLRKRNILERHAFGGVKIDPNSYRVIGSASTLSLHNIYAVGELVKGTFLATTDMSQLNNHARVVASEITGVIKKSRLSQLNRTTSLGEVLTH